MVLQTPIQNCQFSHKSVEVETSSKRLTKTGNLKVATIHQNIRIMKKYQVLSKIGNFSTHVEREFDELDDAWKFCDLLRKSSSHSLTTYGVSMLCEE